MAQAMVLKAEDDYYHVQAGYFKVVTSPKTGNSYAKKYVPETKSRDYYPGAVTKLRPEFKMDLEACKSFGKLYGSCMVCSHVLTDEISISKGIGPICEANFG